jgi:hypothetical protein
MSVEWLLSINSPPALSCPAPMPLIAAATASSFAPPPPPPINVAQRSSTPTGAAAQHPCLWCRMLQFRAKDHMQYYIL